MNTQSQLLKVTRIMRKLAQIVELNTLSDASTWPELECHSLTQDEFQSRSVYDEEDLSWIDKELYSTPDTEIQYEDIKGLIQLASEGAVSKDVKEFGKTVLGYAWSDAHYNLILQFVDAIIAYPDDAENLHTARELIQTTTKTLKLIRG